jgi:hypothetical protein
MTPRFRFGSTIAIAALLCLVPVVIFAQEGAGAPSMVHDNTLPPTPVGPTPKAPDGHPDLTGLWNGLADNLLGVPNQMHNVGIEVAADSTRDINSGVQIATWPLQNRKRQNNEQNERAATLLRRMGSNRPIYKPQYWQRVKDFDANSNEEDPSNNCMPAGVPRMGVPSYIAQTANYLVFVYPGQGGLIATATSYRMIPTDGRQHTNIEDLDGTWNGESIGHWEGDTMVVDSIGFNSTSWFDQLGGYFHSENMHVIERLHRDGNTLTWTATVEDPDVLLEPWTTTPRVVLLNPDTKAILPESLPCSERDFAHVVTKEHH